MAKVRIPRQKVILCGDYGVGKSSLFRRFTNDTFITATDRQSTLGLDHIEKVYEIQDKQIKLQLWDTGGMERVASLTSSYFKFADAAILVFAFDNVASFHSLSQHILDIVTYAENAKIFICGNKSDLETANDIQVSGEDFKEFCEQCQCLVRATYRTSCKTGEGVEEMFQDITRILLECNRSKMDLQINYEQHGGGFMIVDNDMNSLDGNSESSSCVC